MAREPVTEQHATVREVSAQRDRTGGVMGHGSAAVATTRRDAPTGASPPPTSTGDDPSAATNRERHT